MAARRPPPEFSWSELPPLAHPRYRPAVLPLTDGRVLVAGYGEEAAGGTPPRGRRPPPPEALDADRRAWRSAGELVGPRGRLAGVTGLVLDPATMSFRTTDRLPPPAPLRSIALPGGAVLDAGGSAFPAGEFHPVELDGLSVGLQGPAPRRGRLLVARTSPTLLLLADGRVLVVGGHRVDVYGGERERYEPVAEVEVCAPRTLRSRPGGSLVRPRYELGAALLPDGSVIVAGGRDDFFGALPAVEVGQPRRRAEPPAGR